MPAKRKEITDITEGRKHVARFRHPRRENKVVRFDLGDDANYRANLAQLNRIFLDPLLWENPPAATSQLIREQWLGKKSGAKSRIKSGTVSDGSGEKHVTNLELATVIAERDAAELRIKELEDALDAKIRECEHWSGKKLEKRAYVTLREACDAFLKTYTDRDADHTRTVKYDLETFVAAFKPNTTIDKLEGKEIEISAWIRSKKNLKGKTITGGRQKQIRLYIVKMLSESHVTLHSKKIVTAEKHVIIKKWLERTDAESLANALPSPWREMFIIQVAIMLRPDELLTLHRNHFRSEFAVLTLDELEHLTLKRHKSRIIPIPASIRPMIKARFEAVGDILFPEPETGKPWKNPKNFNRRYTHALKKAAVAAGITRIEMDARIGRRTCASLLLQAGVSAETIAELAGNTPAMILTHYGDPDVKNLNLDRNVIGCK